MSGSPYKASEWALVLLVFFVGSLAVPVLAAKAPDRQGAPLASPPRERPYVMQQDRRVDASTGVTLAWYRVDEEYEAASPEAAARKFLLAHTGEIGGLQGDSDFELIEVKESPGGIHVHLRQVYAEVPVYRGYVNVSLAGNTVLMALANPYPGIDLTSTTPSISAQEALSRTRNHLRGAGPDLNEPSMKLVVYRDKAGEDHLAWAVAFATMDPMGDWEVLWDAHSGELLDVIDNMRYIDGGGVVFDPDPLTTAEVNYGGAYSDNNDADNDELNNERFPVTLLDISQNGDEYELEGPYCELLDFESPTIAPATASHPDSFNFTRSQSGFEDVNVYYHIDHAQRHLQELGFDNIQNGPIECDPHGLNGADNSHYIPAVNRLAWGEGGVDDAEDADIIYHEYGHAIQHDQVPNWNGGHTGAMGEGFSDYWAGTFSARVSDYHDTWFANWDGHNPFWNGRVLNYGGVYPDDWQGGYNIHHDGQIWSNCLWMIREDIGADLTDAIVIQAHFYLGYGATVEDGAEALIQADQQLNGGANYEAIAGAAYAKGFLETPPIVGTVTGAVWDDFAQDPIEGAIVSIQEGGITETDEDGLFILHNQPVGDRPITVTANGYNTFLDSVEIVQDDTSEVYAYLTRPRIVPTPEEISFEINDTDQLDTLLFIQNDGEGEMAWALQWREEGMTPPTPWTLEEEVDVLEATGDPRLRGAAVVDGMIAVAGGNSNDNPNKIYYFNAAGDLIGQSDQPTSSFYGFYDLASDGEILFGSEYDWIVGFTADGEVTDSIPGPHDANRGLAYDPQHDWFWCASGSENIRAVDRDGVVQWDLEHSLNIQALAWFPYDPAGKPLYATTAVGGVPRIHRIDLDTGESEEIVEMGDFEPGRVIVGADCSSEIEGFENYWVFPLVEIDAGQTFGELSLFTLASAVNYADAAPTFGSLETGGNDTLSLYFNPSGLAQGYHYLNLDIARPGTDDVVTVPVTMYVHSVSAEEAGLPDQFTIEPAWPNPFNPSVQWTVRTPMSTDLRIRIYDRLGRLVADLHPGRMTAGEHRLSWRAPATLASGVYFARIQAQSVNLQRVEKLVLLR